MAQEEAAKITGGDAGLLSPAKRKFFARLSGEVAMRPLTPWELVQYLTLLAFVHRTEAKKLFLLALEVSFRSQVCFTFLFPDCQHNLTMLFIYFCSSFLLRFDLQQGQLVDTCWRRVLMIDAWDDLKVLVDDALDERIRATVIFGVLCDREPPFPLSFQPNHLIHSYYFFDCFKINKIK